MWVRDKFAFYASNLTGEHVMGKVIGIMK